MAHASTHGARKHAWHTQAAWAKSLIMVFLLYQLFLRCFECVVGRFKLLYVVFVAKAAKYFCLSVS